MLKRKNKDGMVSYTFSRRQLLYGSIICAIGALFYCYEFVLRIVPGILQEELTHAFGNISASTFGEIAALYYLAYSPMQLPVGMLMDRYGPRYLLSFACLCCSIGSYMFSDTTSLGIAGAGRFLIGFGSSFAFVGVLYSAVDWLPPRLFSLVAGLLTTLGMLGVIYGEMKITALASQLSLHNVLLLLVGAGLILTVFIFLIVRDRPDNNKEPHAYYRDFFKQVFGVLVSKQVWMIGFIGASLYSSLSIFGELWGQTYLKYAHQLTTSQSASTISMMFLGWAIGAPLTGFISDLTGQRTLPLLAGSILALISISVILYVPNLSYHALNVWMFLYGVFSSVEIIVFVLGKELTQTNLSGTVFAVTNMIVMLGGVIFQPLVGKLLDLSSGGNMSQGVHVYGMQDYQLAMSTLPILMILTIFTIWRFLKNRK